MERCKNMQCSGYSFANRAVIFHKMFTIFYSSKIGEKMSCQLYKVLRRSHICTFIFVMQGWYTYKDTRRETQLKW